MQTVSFDGIDLECRLAGMGPPLLLVHGFPLDCRMWSEQIEPFAASNQVIAPNLRGFGVSSPVAGKITMAQFADDLARLLNQLEIDQPAAYCGLSMGGYIGWEFLRRHPGRLSKLICCDTRAAADSIEAARGRTIMAARVELQGTAGLAEEMTPKLLCQQSRDERIDLVDALARMIESAPPETVAAAQRGMAERIDATDLLGQISIPTLLIVGEHDAITPAAEMRALSRAIPASQYIELPAAGHMSPMENAEAFNDAVLDFLEE